MTASEYHLYARNGICVDCHQARAADRRVRCEACLLKRRRYMANYDRRLRRNRREVSPACSGRDGEG